MAKVNLTFPPQVAIHLKTPLTIISIPLPNFLILQYIAFSQLDKEKQRQRRDLVFLAGFGHVLVG